MTPGEKKASLLVTRYVDGAAAGLSFIASHQLLLDFEQDDGERVPLMIDLEESTVRPAAKAPEQHAGSLAGCDVLDGLAAVATYMAGEIEIRKGAVVRGARRAERTDKNRQLRDRLITLGKVVRKFERAGKLPSVRFADDGASVFSSATEVLNRWDLKTGKAQKLKCYDRATHVAATGGLIAAQNKEGVVCFFDADRGTRLVSVRPTVKGWIAFADDGAWDCSTGFTRGVELSWTDAKSTAFIPGQGFGRLELNQFPLNVTVPVNGGKTRGLLALRTAGRW